MVNITYSAATRVAEVKPSHDLAGAVFCPAANGFPGLYRAFTMSELSSLVDNGCEVVYGSENELIERQLRERYPTPPRTRRVLYVADYWIDTEHDESRHRRWRDPDKYDSWVILDHPLVEVSEESTEAEVSQWIESLQSPILLDREQLHTGWRDDEAWRKLGFAVQSRRPNLILLSYRPKAVDKTFLRRAQAEYAERMRGYFSCESMRSIYSAMSPDNWTFKTEQYIWSNVITLQNYSNRSLYGPYNESERSMSGYSRPTKETGLKRCRDLCAILAEEILHLLQLSRRLSDNKVAWWHKVRATYGSSYNTDFKSAVRDMLPYLHGVECVAAENAIVAERDEDLDSVVSRWQQLQSFCRWIRREAKVLELPIPARPVPPKSARKPKPKRKRKKGRR